MGILDEAIREHLNLKRQHGAAESELRQLEDEAFGPPARPGQPEAPTQVAPAAEPPAEPPQAPPPSEEPVALEHAVPPPVEDVGEPLAHVGSEPEPAEPETAERPEEAEPLPPEPEPLAGPEGPGSSEPDTSPADQPTEFYDFEGELSSGPSPSAEELAEEEITEPPLGPREQLESDAEPSGAPAEEDRGEEFFSEQSLSDELDQALDAP